MLKKLFIIALISAGLLSFTWNTAYSQDSISHLEFKGIQMKGSINDFADKLVKMGYIIKENTGNVITLEGQFVGKDATIYIAGTPKTNTIWKVMVYLPEVSSWYSIKSDYKYYKDMYTQKYGAPKDVYEFFSKPYYEGDGYEMSALKNDKCHYFSAFHTNEGVVVLEISTFKKVRFSYEDNANTELRNKEKDTAVIDDI